MLYPQIDPAEWAKNYNLEIPQAICQKCHAEQKFTKPFAFKSFRGLISSHDACGEEFRQSIFVTVDKEEREDLGRFVTAFASAGL